MQELNRILEAASMTKESLCFFALMAFSIASSANDDIKCKPGGSQQVMNACAFDDLSEADRELNRTYRKLLQKESKNVVFVNKLRVAQKAWLAFRDADLTATCACEDVDSHVCWGSMQPNVLLTLQGTAHAGSNKMVEGAFGGRAAG